VALLSSERAHHRADWGGQTCIACALGLAACRQGCSTLYGRVPRLLVELARTQLLILDDWGIAPLSMTETRDLLEVSEDRSQRCPTVVASQAPLEHWHTLIADPALADAILDRLVHHAHRIEMQGESMRKVLVNRRQTIGEEDAISNSTGISVHLYGMKTWGSLFNPR